MTYIFYKDVIQEIALQFQFDTVKHLLSRDYADDEVFEYVSSQNPFLIDLDGVTETKKHKKVTMNALKDFGFMK